MKIQTWKSLGLLRCVFWYNFTDFSKYRAIALMVVATNASETSVNIYHNTWRKNSEDQKTANFMFATTRISNLTKATRVDAQQTCPEL